MSPQLSHRMVSMHARTGSNQTYDGSVCYTQHDLAYHYPDIELNKGYWFIPPGYQPSIWKRLHRPKLEDTVSGSLGTDFLNVGPVLLTRSSVHKWPPGKGCNSVCKVPPDKPPGYWLLVGGSNAPPDSNSKILNNLNMRNRSLIPKSRERSDRHGGRWGDKNIRR